MLSTCSVWMSLIVETSLGMLMYYFKLEISIASDYYIADTLDMICQQPN
jgi:hypothetical protein